MSGLLRSMGVALLAAGLSGCVTYPPEYYYPGDAQGGSAYYYGERYDDGYGGDYGYVEQPYAGGYAVGWPAYYSTLWPVYRNYYDPYWSPGFYYGVTWFPSTYFGIGIGAWDAWPYYTAYSPYRYAFWDNYYAWYDPWYYGGYYGHGHGHWDDDDWDDDDHGHGGHGGWRDPPQGGNGPRFGSARNEAERLASLSGAGAQSQAGKYGAAGAAGGRFAGRNWRGTPPQGALSQSGNAGRAPVSNADLYGGGRFANRPGAMPAGAAPGGSGGYRDDARTGYAPGSSAGGARGESQRLGGAPAYPAGDRGNAYNAPRGNAPQAGNPNAGYVGPAPRSRPTGNQDWRRYDQGAQPDANAAAPRSYSRQLPQESYAPIQGSAGGSSRWRSAPPSAPAPDARGYVQGNRGYVPRQQTAPQQGNYGVPQGATVPRYSTRPQGYSTPPQQRYQAPPQNYQAPPQGQPRFQSQQRQSQPRYEAPPPRESSRDDGPSDGGGGFRDSAGSRDSSSGSQGESSRFARGGRDRED